MKEKLNKSEAIERYEAIKAEMQELKTRVGFLFFQIDKDTPKWAVTSSGLYKDLHKHCVEGKELEDDTKEIQKRLALLLANIPADVKVKLIKISSYQYLLSKATLSEKDAKYFNSLKEEREAALLEWLEEQTLSADHGKRDAFQEVINKINER